MERNWIKTPLSLNLLRLHAVNPNFISAISVNILEAPDKLRHDTKEEMMIKEARQEFLLSGNHKLINESFSHSIYQ
jgi:hypothetical protein